MHHNWNCYLPLCRTNPIAHLCDSNWCRGPKRKSWLVLNCKSSWLLLYSTFARQKEMFSGSTGRRFPWAHLRNTPQFHRMTLPLCIWMGRANRHREIFQRYQQLIVHSTIKPTIAASKSFSSVASNIWNALPNHLSSIPTLPAFRRALKHHLFLLAYPNSSAKSGKIKPAQCITLRDTAPTTATALPGNTMPPI